MSASRPPCPTCRPGRAVIVEPHALFAPFLRAQLEAGGLRVLATRRSLRPASIARLRPDVVFLEAVHAGTPGPLPAIRELRRRLPDARIIVHTGAVEPQWPLIARTLGADVVIGPSGGVEELRAALRVPLAA